MLVVVALACAPPPTLPEAAPAPLPVPSPRVQLAGLEAIGFSRLPADGCGDPVSPPDAAPSDLPRLVQLGAGVTLVETHAPLSARLDTTTWSVSVRGACSDRWEFRAGIAGGVVRPNLRIDDVLAPLPDLALQLRGLTNRPGGEWIRSGWELRFVAGAEGATLESVRQAWLFAAGADGELVVGREVRDGSRFVHRQAPVPIERIRACGGDVSVDGVLEEVPAMEALAACALEGRRAERTERGIADPSRLEGAR